MILAPLAIQRFYDNNNNPAVSAKVFTYVAGTTTKQATYTDSTGGTPNTNPIILNYRGEANVWLDPTLTYKFVFAPKDDTDPPTNPYWTVDNIPGGYGGTINWTQIVYPQTAAELAAGVTPVNYFVPSHDISGFVNILRYGADPKNVSDSTTALANAILVSSQNTTSPVYIPAGTYKITSTLNVAAGKQVSFQGAGKFLSILYATGFTSDTPVINYQGSTGSRIDAIHCDSFAIWSNNNLARGITASWVINSRFDNLYFYQLYRGYVGSSCFGNGFRNNNAFGITQDSYLLNSDCNNCTFDKTRAVGATGINIVGQCQALVIKGCDFEGITGNGAAISIAPVTGTVVYGVNIEGCYFENINGTAIFFQGVDANSVNGVVIKGNYITGGKVVYSNAFAVNAITLYHVRGFDISNNEFQDWQTNAIVQIATATNGVIENNTSSVNTVTNLADATPDKSIRVGNNWTNTLINYAPQAEVTVTYSASMAIDSTLGAIFDITATNGTAFTINNATGGYAGKRIWIKLRNSSGGALGAITWGGAMKNSNHTPANGFSYTWEFTHDGSNWIQTGGTPADVPN